jgi:hypothetical protein
MSAIARFIKMPLSAIDGLRKAAIPQKRLFRGTIDLYNDYLRQHGQEVAQYRWSGYVLCPPLHSHLKFWPNTSLSSGSKSTCSLLTATKAFCGCANHFGSRRTPTSAPSAWGCRARCRC